MPEISLLKNLRELIIRDFARVVTIENLIDLIDELVLDGNLFCGVLVPVSGGDNTRNVDLGEEAFVRVVEVFEGQV